MASKILMLEKEGPGWRGNREQELCFAALFGFFLYVCAEFFEQSGEVFSVSFLAAIVLYAGKFPINIDSIETALRDEEDLSKLIGGTISIVYDPDAGLVRSFSVEDIGEMKGSVTIAVRGGGIDPDLLDSSRVTTASTRTLDLAALESMFGDFDFGGSGVRGHSGAKKRKARDDR